MSRTKSTRRHLSPSEKVKILKEHLLEKEPVSKLCEKYGVHPTQIYGWLKTFFENGESAFMRSGGSSEKGGSQERIQQLEDRIKKKDEVIAELLEEHVELKKKTDGVPSLSIGLSRTYGMR
jgi:transposase-like protein